MRSGKRNWGVWQGKHCKAFDLILHFLDILVIFKQNQLIFCVSLTKTQLIAKFCSHMYKYMYVYFCGANKYKMIEINGWLQQRRVAYKVASKIYFNNGTQDEKEGIKRPFIIHMKSSAILKHISIAYVDFKKYIFFCRGPGFCILYLWFLFLQHKTCKCMGLVPSIIRIVFF